MVQPIHQVTSARLAPASKNKYHSAGPLLILCLIIAFKLQANCHSHQFHPIGMPPQHKQMQLPPSPPQQFASESSSRFVSVQPIIASPFAQHPSGLMGANPAGWPTYQASWSHVLRPSPWLHFAKNLVAAPIAIGATNWSPTARHLSLPTDLQQQPTVADPQAISSATPPSHRRASSGQSNPTSSRPAIPHSSAPATHSQGATRSSRLSQEDPHDGKMLICYYATKQTAPYWPTEGREFVVPAGHLERAANEFFAANQNQPAASQLKATLASNEANNKLNEEQAVDSTLSAAGAQLKQRRSIFAYNAAGNGARLVVIAPNLVPAPFNQSIGAKSDGGIATTQLASRHTNELGIDRADSLGQMFHLAASNNNRRRTITERNDLLNGNNNGATLAVNSAPANQSIGKQLAPLQGESNSQATTQNNGGQTGNNNNNNVVFYEHNLHDLNNNRQVGGDGGSLAFSGADANAGLEMHQQKLDASLTGGRRQPLQTVRTSSTLNPISRNGGTSLSPTAAPQRDGPIQNRNSNSDHINSSSEQLNQFYYYYNLPTMSQASGQGWKNAGFSAGVAPTSGPSSAQSTLATNRFKSATFPQSIHSGGSQAQQGKSLQVPEANLDELNRATHASVSLLGSSATSGTSVSPSGSPFWPSSSSSSQSSPSSSSSSSSLAMPNSATTKPSSSLVFSRQPPERLQASNRPKLVSIASNSFSLDGQRYLSSAPVESTDSMHLASPSASSPDVHEASLAESFSLSKTTPAMSSSSLSSGSGFFSSPVMERPVGLALNQHSIQQTTSKLADELPLSSANNRNFREPAETVKQTSIGLGGGNSLSASLVSSPLSTMFDVFGAASQYLMRLRPSSLISPASFAAFNSIGEYNSHHSGATKGRALNSSASSSLSSLVSSFGSSKGHSDHQRTTSANRSAASQADHNTAGGGLLSRLTLQLGQNQQQRREEICGRTIQTPERRIIGGEGAKYGEFPYQVHIKIAKHQCGGALIDRQSIVTAAHCVYHFITRAPVNKLQIVIGAYDIEDEQYQELPPQYFKVNKVKLHPNFRFSASHPDRYDVAILKLDKPVKYTDNVLPVCLPGKELKYDNMVGTVTGFGKTDPSLSNRYGTRLLQKVDVPIIENSECERWHRTRGIDLKIFPEMMCAGYEDGLKDACVGDSGGPLVVKTPTGSNGSFRWTLAGITSAGFGCAQSRQPGIYHRVSHTVDWILDNLD